MLQVEGISLNFGGVRALSDVSVGIRDREIFAIIGPNGAGKTCLLNCISGFYRPQEGKILFDGKDISKLRPDQIATLGIGRSFQNVELYTGLSTVDNLLAARHNLMKHNILEGAFYFGKAHREELKHREAVEEIIDLLDLASVRKKAVGILPFGIRKKVDLGRALATEPQILLLDEPMAGMNIEEKEDMARYIIDTFEQRRTTIVLIEHDMGVVMDIADRIAVLDFGRKIAEGTPNEISKNPIVIKAYLGEEITVA